MRQRNRASIPTSEEPPPPSTRRTSVAIAFDEEQPAIAFERYLTIGSGRVNAADPLYRTRALASALSCTTVPTPAYAYLSPKICLAAENVYSPLQWPGAILSTL
jgi:hypothetical protein